MLRTAVNNIFNNQLYITCEPTSAFHTKWTYIKALKKRGYKELGRGCFATVLAKDGTDRVIKVMHGEESWPKYIEWAREKGYEGTWAPKVYRYKQHKGFTVAVVERMKDSFYTMDNKSALKPLTELTRLHGEHGNETAALMSELLVPGISKFMEDLRTTFHYHLDLHEANVMVRANGTVCFTDPVSN